MWDEITYPFLNFNGCTIEVSEWISNFIPHFTGHVITYPCWHQMVPGHLQAHCWQCCKDSMTWKHFPHSRPFVRGIHLTCWFPSQRPSNAELWYFFVVSLKMLFNKLWCFFVVSLKCCSTNSWFANLFETLSHTCYITEMMKSNAPCLWHLISEYWIWSYVTL